MKTQEFTSSFPVNINNCNGVDLRQYFVNSWNLTEFLFSSIKEVQSLYINPDPRRHPLIFYFGHVAVFYINKLRIAGLYADQINPVFENLFAVGVDPSTKDDLEKYGWPQYEKVADFRAKVYEVVLTLLESVAIPEQVNWDHPLWSVLMAIEHERIHFETSSVLIRQYSPNLVEKPAGWNYKMDSDYIPDSGFVAIEGGSVLLGRPTDSNMYGWDNEYGCLSVAVPKFEAAKNMVTNQEYLQFVHAGGYENKELWSEAGWKWITEQDIHFPKFWERDGMGYKFRAMFDVIDMPLNWPVEVIAHEAEAFCKWKGGGYRLMSEAEWKRITDLYFQSPQRDFPDMQEANINFRNGSSVPVGYYGGKAPYDIIGNVWEILGNDFYPLPGFKPHPYYKDFSFPFFDAQHGMMAGGSWASTGNSASRYYRLWFRRDFVQHAGFRLVKG